MTVESLTSKFIIIFAHFMVWMVFGIAIFFYHPLFSGIDIPWQAWIMQAVTLILLVIAFYVNTIILVPRLLLKNQTFYYFAMFIVLIAVIAFINSGTERLIDTRHQFAHQIQERKTEFTSAPGPARHRLLDRPTVIICALVLVAGTSITVIQKWQKDKQEREALEKEKVSTELLLLKAQINPHFFFNTLNNIYALTRVDADQAGNAIHRLSHLMRYLLYETQHGQTLLSREIAFIRDYISLMKLRLTSAAIVTIDTPSQLNDMPMAPMILLPFVENAFKHGISATTQSHVSILIVQQSSWLDITVKNSVMKNNTSSLDTNSGIGLLNTRRRLEILYPNKYKLEIAEMNAVNEYTVHLILDLS